MSSLDGYAYWWTVDAEGKRQTKHRTHTAAAKRIVKEGKVGEWDAQVEGTLGRLIEPFAKERAEIDALLRPS